ncbi:MAG TPA: hypothetical protein VMW33_05285 [Ilumatobacteraceae bacterium]|jgi:hypothetical protein|nr:hypothetical protein [Ilumatobacteraceae bacterium]
MIRQGARRAALFVVSLADMERDLFGDGFEPIEVTLNEGGE